MHACIISWMEMLWVLQHLRCCQRRKKWCHTSQLMCRNTHGSIISTLALDGHIHNICSRRWFSCINWLFYPFRKTFDSGPLGIYWGDGDWRSHHHRTQAPLGQNWTLQGSPGWWDGIRAEVTTYPCFFTSEWAACETWPDLSCWILIMEDDGRWWQMMETLISTPYFLHISAQLRDGLW